MKSTRRAVFWIAILGFALALAGCSGITTDLHDIFTVTLDPLEGVINGSRVATMQTDVHGRLVNLPNPVHGGWTYICDEYEIDSDGNPWDGTNHSRPAWPHEPEYPGDVWIVWTHENTPTRCEYLGCDSYHLGTGWSFVEQTGGPVFVGWFTPGGTRVTENFVFTADTTIRARWWSPGQAPLETSAEGRLNELRDLWWGGFVPTNWNITVGEDEYISPQDLSFGGSAITITLRGAVHPFLEGYTHLRLNSAGPMFRVGAGVTLDIENIQLIGFHRNIEAMIVIEDGGRVIIRGDGAPDDLDPNAMGFPNRTMLRENRVTSTMHGGAITVNRGGELIMHGGALNNNFVRWTRPGVNINTGGGGVWVRGGTFTMNDGIMQDNIVLGAGAGIRVSHGGNFVMNGGVIYQNMSWFSGGVHVTGGEVRTDTMPFTAQSVFTMNDGEIVDNWSALFGGGVTVWTHGHFHMHNGSIVLNESREGAGILNLGHVIIFNGEIMANDGRPGTGGITNLELVHFWDGDIYFNMGGFGGGVRNWGDFYMMGGSIQGNVGDGAPAGGVANFGQFMMHGGEVSNNSSTSQGGGVFHGLAGSSDASFTMIDGMIWNNRDLTTHHDAGLPGSMGNIRRNTSYAETFRLGRRGFYSFNAADRPGLNWAMTSGPVPVFQHNDLPTSAAVWNWYNRTGGIPQAWPVRTVYHFEPPALTPPLNMAHTFFTLGRPRVIRGIPGAGGDVLDMDTTVQAMTPAAMHPDVRDRRPIRGGSVLPSSLVTLHNTLSTEPDAGYFWRVRNGQLIAAAYTTVSGIGTNFGSVDNWPGVGGIMLFVNNVTGVRMGSLLNFLPTLDPVWPWIQLNGPPDPFPSPQPSPQTSPQPAPNGEIIEEMTFERLRRWIPNFDQWVEDRVQNLSSFAHSIESPSDLFIQQLRQNILTQHEDPEALRQFEERVNQRLPGIFDNWGDNPFPSHGR